jgi:hypothetical protein
MKKHYTIILLVLFAASVFAQSPQRMSYQAVIRNSSNVLVISSPVGMRVSVLQDSPTGTEVYKEIYNPNPQTNANGLVTIEIGGGIPLTGTFSAIDWSDGPYFIKSETDPTGGTNYTITGTSQLLSVPYALHAKNADTYDEIDPVFVLSPSSAITSEYISDWNTAFGWGNHAAAGYVPGTRTITINGTALDLTASRSWSVGTITLLTTNNGITGGTITTAGTIGLTGQALALHNLGTNGLIARTESGTVASRIITAGSGITVTNGDGVNGNPTIGVKTYQVGDFAQGGIVFWVDETGQHGLVCAKNDQDGGSGVRWYAGTYGNTQAKGNGPFAGEANTSIIIAAQVAIGDDGATYAARICNELQITESSKTYGDWYLPSKDELILISQNYSAINAVATANGGTVFSTSGYWSSTEDFANGARLVDLTTGDLYGDYKDAIYRVRAVRAF